MDETSRPLDVVQLHDFQLACPSSAYVPSGLPKSLAPCRVERCYLRVKQTTCLVKLTSNSSGAFNNLARHHSCSTGNI